MTVITGSNITLYRLLTLRSALRLEVKGMRRRGRSVYAIVKDEFGFKGSKAKVLKQLEERIEQMSNTSTADEVEHD
jgi:hypothetical protein